MVSSVRNEEDHFIVEEELTASASDCRDLALSQLWAFKAFSLLLYAFLFWWTLSCRNSIMKKVSIIVEEELAVSKPKPKDITVEHPELVNELPLYVDDIDDKQSIEPLIGQPLRVTDFLVNTILSNVHNEEGHLIVKEELAVSASDSRDVATEQPILTGTPPLPSYTPRLVKDDPNIKTP